MPIPANRTSVDATIADIQSSGGGRLVLHLSRSGTGLDTLAVGQFGGIVAFHGASDIERFFKEVRQAEAEYRELMGPAEKPLNVVEPRTPVAQAPTKKQIGGKKWGFW